MILALFQSSALDPDLLSKGTLVSATTRDWLIIFGAITLLTGALVIFAYLSRKNKDETSGRRSHRPWWRRHHSHAHSHSHSHSPEPGEKSSESSAGGETSEPGKRRRKWRRRRREHRPRNPTLAETGGLPPLRSPGPPSSPP
jgi:hypothetical protein